MSFYGLSLRLRAPVFVYACACICMLHVFVCLCAWQLHACACAYAYACMCEEGLLLQYPHNGMFGLLGAYTTLEEEKRLEKFRDCVRERVYVRMHVLILVCVCGRVILSHENCLPPLLLLSVFVLVFVLGPYTTPEEGKRFEKCSADAYREQGCD